QRHHAGDVLALVWLNPGQFVEIADFARDLHRLLAGIEAADAGYAALARQHCPAEGFPANPVRTDHTHSSDDDSFHDLLRCELRCFGYGPWHNSRTQKWHNQTYWAAMPLGLYMRPSADALRRMDMQRRANAEFQSVC